MRPVAENSNSENNIRGILQLLGDKGLLAQSANGELMIALKAAELGFSMPITVATLPTIGVSSMPNLVVSTMPSLTVGSVPSLTIGSIPTITANPTKPTLLAHGLLGATATTMFTAAAAYRDVSVYLTNVDTAERTAQVQLNATTPATMDDTHSLVKGHPLSVGDRSPIFLPGIANTDVIYGLCDSANKVSYQIWGTA
jgi:hypothetical protein